MGVARLLAKAWIVFCLFAGGHAFALALARGEVPLESFQAIAICVLLFGAMGLLFIGGFGASTGTVPALTRLRWPGFNEVVFVVFVALSLIVQVFVAPLSPGHATAAALQFAMLNAMPGQAALAAALGRCSLDGGREFASAFTWLLAIIFVASSLSRVRLTAGIARLDQMLRPSAFGPTMLAALYGIVAIVGIQLLCVGSLYPWLDCSAFPDLPGAVLIGLAPLYLAYLIVAALTTLRASAPDQ
jgi:hypothetical protein